MRVMFFGFMIALLATQAVQAQQFPTFKEAPAMDQSAAMPAAPYGSVGGYGAPVAPGYAPMAPGYGSYPPAYYPMPYYPQPGPMYYGNPAPPYSYGPAPAYPPAYPTGYGDQGNPPADPPAPPTPPEMPMGAPEDYQHAPPLPTHGDASMPELKHDTPPCFWLSADYLAGWIRRGPLAAPLVTVGSAADIAPGAIGQPGTSVLFGGSGLDFGMQSGIKAQLGLWLDCDRHYSLDVGGFSLFQTHRNFSVASDAAGNPIITRPIFNVVDNAEEAELVSFPGLATGSSTVDTATSLWGLEFNGRCHVYFSPRLQADALLGFRYLNLRESIDVTDSLKTLGFGPFTFNGNFLNPGDVLTDRDSFSTSNDFYGGQVGFQLRRQFGPFYVADLDKLPFQFDMDLFAKVAIGTTTQHVHINGETTLVPAAGSIQTLPGGILAVGSNTGNFSRSVFGIVPEMGVTLNLDITPHFRLQAGYSFLLWNAVARPGSQIDRSVNPNQIPSDQSFGIPGGPVRPVFAFHDDTVWVNNLYFGVEFRH